MKTKYDIELTINNITNKGQMEIYDDSLMLYINTKTRIIKFENIKKNLLENDLLKLRLIDDITLFIKTVRTEDIHNFIELQRNEDDTYPISFKTKEQYNLRRYIKSFIVIFFVIWLLSGFITDSSFVVSYLFMSALFAIPAMFIVSANSNDKDRATALCPHCHKTIKLRSNIGGVVLPITENMVDKSSCGYCGNMFGMKYNHLYKLTPQNKSQFETQVKPLSQTNTEKLKDYSNENDYEKLEKLKELLDKNIITQEEFDKKKQDILNKL